MLDLRRSIILGEKIQKENSFVLYSNFNLLNCNLILFYQTIFFLLGASIGSFLNAWSLRITSDDESIFAPSKCRSCEKKLQWHQLIPVLSWAMQFGKCGCKRKEKISPQYIFTEIILGLCFVIIFNLNGFSVDVIFYLVFASVLFFLVLTDLNYQLLHFPTIIFGIFLGVIYGALQDKIVEVTVGALCGFLIIFIVNFLFRTFRNKDGFGDGDKYLLAMLGMWTGAIIVLQILVLASWIGVIYSVILRSYQGCFPTKLPLAPLFVSALLLIYINQQLSII
jgi:leader peptidase (prepilin peptidase)/N-methyltransferase